MYSESNTSCSVAPYPKLRTKRLKRRSRTCERKFQGTWELRELCLLTTIRSSNRLRNWTDKRRTRSARRKSWATSVKYPATYILNVNNNQRPNNRIFSLTVFCLSFCFAILFALWRCVSCPLSDLLCTIDRHHPIDDMSIMWRSTCSIITYSIEERQHLADLGHIQRIEQICFQQIASFLFIKTVQNLNERVIRSCFK
jgi:hypothetical protein